MASLRKRYQTQAGAESKDGPPVLSPPPGGAAKLPDPVETRPVEPMAESSPADEAARTALRARLAEMEQAEKLARQQLQQAEEPQTQQPQQPAVPARVQEWLNRHPQYMDPADAIAQAEVYTATLKCSRDGKDWNDDDFIPHLERHLGLAPSGNGHDKPPPQPVNHAPARRDSAPQRQQAPQRMARHSRANAVEA